MRCPRLFRILALCLAAGSAQGAVTHSLLPWKAQAGKTFDLMLAGPYACNHSFSHESTYVLPDRIVLAFLATESNVIRCAPLTRPYGPEFRFPALAAGEYPIYSQSLVPCLVGPAACEIFVAPVFVGTLKVTSAAPFDTGWFLHPKRIESGKDARVSLLNLARGSCENDFQPARDTVRGRAAELSFTTHYYRRMCATSVRPFGPEFLLGDLTPGSYRVEGYDLPECAFQDPPCLPIVPYKPVLVDTLVVGVTTALRQSPERRTGSAPRLLRLRGGLGVAWPVGEGTALGFRDERGDERVVTPDGRRVRPVFRVLPLNP
jgi:hypothetical protein